MEWIEFDSSKLIYHAQGYLITDGTTVRPAEYVCYKGKYFFRTDVGLCDGITHYMPFPKPPKKEET